MTKRWIYLSLVSIIACTIGGCNTQNSTSQDSDSQTTDNAEAKPAWERYADDDPVTLDWYVNYSWFNMSWGKNMVSKKMTDETGVSVNFITPLGNEDEKLNALITSDSLPDIITLGWWEPQINALINNGLVYSLNDLADKYDAYFYKVADQDVINWYAEDDGNIYGYPNSTFTPEDVENNDRVASNQTFLVRKDIYEAIGSPDMSTQEGFEAAVKKAVEMFPEVDGKPLIPIGAHEFGGSGCVSFDSYLMNFLAVPYEKDGQLYDRYTDPEYLSWLKLFRKLGQEGYLSNDIFVDQRAQMNEKILEGRYFCMLYQRTDIADQEKEIYTNNPDRVYIAVDGPRNSNGDDHVLPTTTIDGWTLTFISKNCKNPDRAIAFIDYMMSEHGQKLMELGVEGDMYTEQDGKYVINTDVKEMLNSDRTQYNEVYGADDAYWMMMNTVMQLKWKPDDIEPIQQMEEWTYPYKAYTGQYDVNMDANSEAGAASHKIDTLWSETLPKLLLADSDDTFDRIVDDFVQQREEMGYDVFIAEKTKLVAQNKEKLGMK